MENKELKFHIKYRGTPDKTGKQQFYTLGDLSIRTEYNNKIRGKEEYNFTIILANGVKQIKFIHVHWSKKMGNSGLAEAIIKNKYNIIKWIFDK